MKFKLKEDKDELFFSLEIIGDDVLLKCEDSSGCEYNLLIIDKKSGKFCRLGSVHLDGLSLDEDGKIEEIDEDDVLN